jgi:prepilin-type N-terminal cleavage/methylation domain-containing protein
VKTRIRRSARSRRQAGFTLIELMVSLVMFSFAIAGVLGIAVSLTAGYREQRQAINAESSVRVPMDFMADALRQASPAVPVSAAGSMIDASGTSCVDGAITVTNSSTGPDRLDVIYASGAIVTTTRTVVDATSTTVTVTDPSQLAQDDYVVISDTGHGVLYKIAGVNAGTGVVTFASLCASPVLPWTTDFPTGSIVVRAQHAEFYVDAVDGIPTLMMDPDGPAGTLDGEPLAEGVEDFQVALGVDKDANLSIGTENTGTADADEWVGNHSGDTPYVVGTGTVRAVRITIVSRAPTPVQGTANTFARPAAEDRAAGSADKYRRRVLHTTVEVRNVESSP